MAVRYADASAAYGRLAFICAELWQTKGALKATGCFVRVPHLYDQALTFAHVSRHKTFEKHGQ